MYTFTSRRESRNGAWLDLFCVFWGRVSICQYSPQNAGAVVTSSSCSRAASFLSSNRSVAILCLYLVFPGSFHALGFFHLMFPSLNNLAAERPFLCPVHRRSFTWLLIRCPLPRHSELVENRKRVRVYLENGETAQCRSQFTDRRNKGKKEK